ncbi:hypothetical protein ANN_07691 [Periplaneta americana]|uniref:Uncharacterized protein n=1 Tax=Periplaneta americana TaxID=6978 RepID=A0ABQ8T0H6_PERAM|nr:hypothetical protein ANN_07691 [Periplaneta americana]
MSPGSSTESYRAFARIGLRENPGKTSTRKQKFPRDTSKGKVMLEVFFDSQGLIHHEFIPEGRTVTKELYVEILLRLRDSHNITALDHSPDSPDLSPPDYFLFPRLKSHLKGRRFNAEEVIANATRALRRVSQDGFQACFQELYTRWQSEIDGVCGCDISLFKYAHLSSCDVERPYKSLFRDNRHAFVMENLEMTFVVHCNSRPTTSIQVWLETFNNLDDWQAAVVVKPGVYDDGEVQRCLISNRLPISKYDYKTVQYDRNGLGFVVAVKGDKEPKWRGDYIQCLSSVRNATCLQIKSWQRYTRRTAMHVCRLYQESHVAVVSRLSELRLQKDGDKTDNCDKFCGIENILPGVPTTQRQECFKIGRLQWAGHLVRMDDTRPAKRAFTSNPGGSRSKGRPKSRWEDNVYEDANFIVARMWTVKARSRDGWNKILGPSMGCRANDDDDDSLRYFK